MAAVLQFVCFDEATPDIRVIYERLMANQDMYTKDQKGNSSNGVNHYPWQEEKPTAPKPGQPREFNLPGIAKALQKEFAK